MFGIPCKTDIDDMKRKLYERSEYISHTGLEDVAKNAAGNWEINYNIASES